MANGSDSNGLNLMFAVSSRRISDRENKGRALVAPHSAKERVKRKPGRPPNLRSGPSLILSAGPAHLDGICSDPVDFGCTDVSLSIGGIAGRRTLSRLTDQTAKTVTHSSCFFDARL